MISAINTTPPETEVQKELNKPLGRGCKFCSKYGKKMETGYAKWFYRGHDGKLPRLELEIDGTKYNYPIRFCPECGSKLH